jgi:RNA polymerase sigma-70 factor, ECF subfamily
MTAESVSRAQQIFATWVRDHGLAVRGYLLGMIRRSDVADDLLQEVFQRAWKSRDRYRDLGHERAFLLKIADRLVIDRSRRPGLEVNVDDVTWNELEPAAPDDGLLDLEKSIELAAALQQLSPNQRRVLLLRYFSDMTFEQIAEAMSCPLGTALSHCRRGLATMRRLLATSE